MEKNFTPDILETLPYLSNDQVFTSPQVVNKMLDLLPKELWRNSEATFLDPCSKSGVFLREIAKRLLEGLQDQIPDPQERINHIMKHQLYGIATEDLTAYMSRRTLYTNKNADRTKITNKDNTYLVPTCFDDNPKGNVFFELIPHTFENGKCKYCGINDKEFTEENRKGKNIYAYPFIHNILGLVEEHPQHPNFFKLLEEMKFDVIIGNPPYQMNVGVEKKNFAIAIYHKFVQQAIKLDPHYLVMITPSRWFAGGRGLDDFRDEMLNDHRLKEIHDYPNASDVFPGVEIKGGVNFFLWQSDYQGDCLIKTYENGEVISEMKRPLKEEGADVFIRYNEAIPILQKVQSLGEKSFAEVVSSRKPFGLASTIKGNSTPYKNDENIVLYQTKGTAYYKKSDISQNEQWIDAHKVFVPKAIGSGNMNDVVNPIYAEPNTACTETYLVIGPFRDKQRCENVISYMSTKFFHFVFGLKKITQNTAKGTYQFVPMQDFSKSWTDEELYKKYNFTQEEIDYIESVVWANKNEK